MKFAPLEIAIAVPVSHCTPQTFKRIYTALGKELTKITGLDYSAMVANMADEQAIAAMRHIYATTLKEGV